MYEKRCAHIGATNGTTMLDTMKVIVNDKGSPKGKKDRKKFAMNENVDCDDGDEPIGRVDGKYDFIMMVGDGTVYGFEGEKIDFTPIGD